MMGDVKGTTSFSQFVHFLLILYVLESAFIKSTEIYGQILNKTTPNSGLLAPIVVLAYFMRVYHLYAFLNRLPLTQLL